MRRSPRNLTLRVMMYAMAIVGSVLLFGGQMLFARGTMNVIGRLRIPHPFAGMPLVAITASAPVLTASLAAALSGRPDIAIGSVVGSNFFGVLGVLGLSAIASPLVVRPAVLKRDTSLMIAASVMMVAASQMPQIGRESGTILLAAMAAYIRFTRRDDTRVTSAKADVSDDAEGSPTLESMWTAIAYLATGLVGLVIGSRLLVTGAAALARSFGVSEAVVGLSLVAACSSLPLLAMCMTAALQGHSETAVTTVVKGNLFNLLFVIGTISLISPIGVADQIAHYDVWMMLGASVAIAPLLFLSGRIGRITGLGFLSAYVLYIARLYGA